MPPARHHLVIPARAWMVLGLSGLAGMLFYLDRQTLAVLKTTLKGELGWTDTDYGRITSFFMVTYTMGYFFSGWLIDRWGTRVMMPLFLLVMSVSTLLTGMANHRWEFVACRIALGAVGGGIVPAVMVAIIMWFPYDRRGTANMFNKPLTTSGNILVLPLAVWLTSTLDWRWAFFVPALAGFVLAVFWWLGDRNPPVYGEVRIAGDSRGVEAKVPAVSVAPSGYRAVLCNPALWGLMIARAVSDPLWFFLVFWQAGYFQDAQGMALQRLGKIGWIPFAVSLVFNMGFNLLSDRFIDWGWTPAASRLRILQSLAVLALVALVLPYLTSHVAVIVVMCILQTVALAWFNLSNLLMSDLMPRQQVGTAVGIINACGAGTGALTNFYVGSLVEQFGYGKIFLAGALLHPIAAVVLWWFYQRRRTGKVGFRQGSV